MRYLAIMLIVAPASICAIAAAVLAFHGMAGWGWFLLIACMLGGGVSAKGL